MPGSFSAAGSMKMSREKIFAACAGGPYAHPVHSLDKMTGRARTRQCGPVPAEPPGGRPENRCRMNISIAIPTYERGAVLVDTVRMLLRQDPPAAEIILADQTAVHAPPIERQLQRWDAAGAVRRLRLPEPSIPRAMNRALLTARSPAVLFLDDDLIPAVGLVGAHARNYRDESVWAVSGQVLQPDQGVLREQPRARGRGIWRDLNFPFNAEGRCEVFNCMAGNLSVRRAMALAAGGFDENFVGVSCRVETEFARRLVRLGGRVVFDSAASIRHLQCSRGGTRVHGDRLRSPSPAHSVGDYYFALREPAGTRRLRYALARMAKSSATRFHMRNPWFIPLKLWGEMLGLAWAARLVRRGPRLVPREVVENPGQR